MKFEYGVPTNLVEFYREFVHSDPRIAPYFNAFRIEYIYNHKEDEGVKVITIDAEDDYSAGEIAFQSLDEEATIYFPEDYLELMRKEAENQMT